MIECVTSGVLRAAMPTAVQAGARRPIQYAMSECLCSRIVFSFELMPPILRFRPGTTTRPSNFGSMTCQVLRSPAFRGRCQLGLIATDRWRSLPSRRQLAAIAMSPLPI